MPTLTYAHTGDRFEVPQGTSLLEFCLGHDTPQPFGCQSGRCGTCCVIVEEGVPDPLAAAEAESTTLENVTEQAGARLACLLTMAGNLTVRPYEE